MHVGYSNFHITTLHMYTFTFIPSILMYSVASMQLLLKYVPSHLFFCAFQVLIYLHALLFFKMFLKMIIAELALKRLKLTDCRSLIREYGSTLYVLMYCVMKWEITKGQNMLVHVIWGGSKQLEYSFLEIESASRFIPPRSKMRGIRFSVTLVALLVEMTHSLVSTVAKNLNCHDAGCDL